MVKSNLIEPYQYRIEIHVLALLMIKVIILRMVQSLQPPNKVHHLKWFDSNNRAANIIGMEICLFLSLKQVKLRRSNVLIIVYCPIWTHVINNSATLRRGLVAVNENDI